MKVETRTLAAVAMLTLSVGLIACGLVSGEAVETTSDYIPGAKVSANNASMADLQAAFEHAGISNARQWAREVAEYRPYAEDDPNHLKLRGELGKYNPAPGVVDQIIAQLELP